MVKNNQVNKFLLVYTKGC